MPRAHGNDLCEIFGYAPDDRSDASRKQWKSQKCPFVGGICIKHSHPQKGASVVVYGSCSVVNKPRNAPNEEVILCPQRLYAEGYKALKACMADAIGRVPAMYMAAEYSKQKRKKSLPEEYVVILGRNSGKEISLSNPGVIELSLDWVLAHVVNNKPVLIVPCEVQSIDTTGNYHANWRAYAEEQITIPDSKHGMNWANVWKRIIPQLILKSAISSTSKLCSKGIYFIVPDRVYIQFEKVVGAVEPVPSPQPGGLTVMSYCLGPEVPVGRLRDSALQESANADNGIRHGFCFRKADAVRLSTGRKSCKRSGRALDGLNSGGADIPVCPEMRVELHLEFGTNLSLPPDGAAAMKFPADAPVTAAKLEELRQRLARLRIALAAVDEQAVKGGGPGGQKANKTQSGVLLRYALPKAGGETDAPRGESERGGELLVVKWTRERQHALNRFLALRELADEVEARISPRTSARLKQQARIRKQKDRARRR